MPPRKRTQRTREEIDRDFNNMGYPAGTKMTSALIRQSKEKGVTIESESIIPQNALEGRQPLIQIKDQPLVPIAKSPHKMVQSTLERREPRFDECDLGYLINHLSRQKNCEILTGSGSETKVGGLSQGAKWGVLAAKLSNEHNN